MSFVKRRGRRAAVDMSVDMTPMLDIVFILLIFFIVTATFMQERGLDLSQDVGGGDNVARTIDVYVYEDGMVSVDGKKSDVTSVTARVEQLHALAPERLVSLRAHGNAVLKHVVYLEDEFTQAGVATTLKIDRD